VGDDGREGGRARGKKKEKKKKKNRRTAGNEGEKREEREDMPKVPTSLNYKFISRITVDANPLLKEAKNARYEICMFSMTGRG